MAPKILPIPGIPEYGLSKDGRVWRVKPYPSGHVRKLPFEMATHLAVGYRKLSLSMGAGRMVKFSVARLMLLTFIGPPPTPKHEAAHGNGRRNDDRIENLRWATRKENLADRILHGTDCSGERNGNCKLSTKQVNKIKELLATKRVSQSQIARDYGMSQTVIWGIANGRLRKRG